MGKVSKADIIDAVYEKTTWKRKDVRKLVDIFLEEIMTALISYDTVELRGFGTFEIRIRKALEKARNPKTGEIVSVGSRGKVAFRAGRDLKREIRSIKAKDE